MGYNSKLGQVNSNIQPLGICILCGSSCKGSCSGSCKGGVVKNAIINVLVRVETIVLTRIGAVLNRKRIKGLILASFNFSDIEG